MDILREEEGDSDANVHEEVMDIVAIAAEDDNVRIRLINDRALKTVLERLNNVKLQKSSVAVL